MNCPMVQPKISFEGGEEMVSFAKCTQEECAWWLPVDQSCVIVGIHYRLANLVEFLDIIKDKMPHAERFKG